MIMGIPESQKYLDAVEHCMVERMYLNRDIVRTHMNQDTEYIQHLFVEDGDVIFHDDPMRLATTFAHRWHLIESKPRFIHRQ
ncbi:hypothetical protein [Sulfoacidibacillus ferrooxidans]|uniref:Uncharacterized protein n=1 Tax=Sulfoacidibacillus ferrooxidans TaxID=2005001 RepID=A0A9X1VEP3_9BACL|nr:hypothetical protein [Sulfoacidibacillus ferrooxidans]MCI0184642.1 hypothetical protein [Sulfoacidibacillus ferrooxidans]